MRNILSIKITGKGFILRTQAESYFWYTGGCGVLEKKRNWLFGQTWITHRDQRRQSSVEKPVNCIPITLSVRPRTQRQKKQIQSRGRKERKKCPLD